MKTETRKATYTFNYPHGNYAAVDGMVIEEICNRRGVGIKYPGKDGVHNPEVTKAIILEIDEGTPMMVLGEIFQALADNYAVSDEIVGD